MAHIIIDREHAEHVTETQRGFWNPMPIPEGDGTPRISLSVCERDGALWCTDGFGAYELECKAGDIVAHLIGYLKWTPEQVASLVRAHCAADVALFGSDYADAEAVEAVWTLDEPEDEDYEY